MYFYIYAKIILFVVINTNIRFLTPQVLFLYFEMILMLVKIMSGFFLLKSQPSILQELAFSHIGWGVENCFSVTTCVVTKLIG